MDAIDLFCGAGGFSKGMERAGFRIRLGIDNNPKVEKTYTENHRQSEFLCLDIGTDIPDRICGQYRDQLDLVFGSPPCQNFSDIGKRDANSATPLPLAFIEWVGRLKPKMALMENVQGFLTMNYGDKLFAEKVISAFHKIGYGIRIGLLNASHHGVPQERMRSFCVAYRDEYTDVLESYPFPIPDHLPNDFQKTEKKERPYRLWTFRETPEYFFPSEYRDVKTVSDVLENLPDPTEHSLAIKYNGNQLHNHHLVRIPKPKEKRIVSRIPEGKMYRSIRFGENFIGVWDLFRDELEASERILLLFICRFRTRKDCRSLNIRKNRINFDGIETVGQLIELLIHNGYLSTRKGTKWSEKIDDLNTDPQQIAKILAQDGWLRKKEISQKDYYDVNSKSGVMTRYRRLDSNEPSITITTHSFDIRNKVHPIENRPITLREGAMIQSFPNDFFFHGSKKDVAVMIGNAVPPVLAYKLGIYYKDILELSKSKTTREIISKLVDSKLIEYNRIEKWFG